MQVNINDKGLDELVSKAMKKRHIKVKADYIRALIKRDCRELQIIKVDELV